MDFHKICRLCARTPTDESVIEIFSPASNLIMMKIQACCPVQIAADDDLPTNICTLCCEKLDEYFNFRMDMMSADLILRSHLKDGKLVKTSVSPSIAVEDNGDMLPIAVMLGDEGTELSDISDYTVEETNDSTYSDDEPLAIKIQRIKREKKKKNTRPSSICPVCGKELKDPSFREHMINVHDIGTPATPYHCNLCGKAFKTKQKMRAHRKTHSLMRFNCDQCSRSYKTKALLDKHIKVKHLGIKEHICSICNKEFGEKKHWKRHLITHTGEKPFVCTICPRTFTNDWNCKKHIRNHNNNVDSSEASDVSDDDKFDDNHDEPKIKPKSVCPICGKELLKSSLAEHLANVHDVGIPPTKYECDICKKVLKTSQKLRTHKKTHHTVRYHCDKCEKTFKIKSVLDRHVKIIHLGIKEHICSVCHHAFGEKKHLKQHMISHSGEKPFVCTFCPKSFTNDWNCKMHIRRHNNIRPYSCDQCEMTFIQNMELKSHIKRVHEYKNNKPTVIPPPSSSCIV